jgi:di/tricarboxylate transporter
LANQVCDEYGLEAITNETENDDMDVGDMTSAGAEMTLPALTLLSPTATETQQQQQAVPRERSTSAASASSPMSSPGLGPVDDSDWGLPGFGESLGSSRSDGEEEEKDGFGLTSDEKIGQGSWGRSALPRLASREIPQSPLTNVVSEDIVHSRLKAIQAIRNLIREERMELSESEGNSPIHTPKPKQRLARKRSIGRGSASVEMLDSLAPATVIVASDPSTSKKNVVFIAINAADRPGLVHDISKGLKRLSLQALNNEASVVGLRSINLWRCEVGGGLRAERRRREGVDETDIQEIWSVLTALLESTTGSEAIKQRGLRVLRASIPTGSGLVGKTAEESDFRTKYRSAIVAIQRSGGNPSGSLKKTRFMAKDVLILQVGEDSVLLSTDYARALKRVEARGSTTPTSKPIGRSTSFDKFRAAAAAFSDTHESSHEEEAAEAVDYKDDDTGRAEMKLSSSVEKRLSVMESPRTKSDKDEMEILASDLKIVSNIQPTITENGDEDEVDTDDDTADGGEEGGLPGGEDDVVVGREFLAAYYVGKKSPLIGKNVKDAGIASLPGLFLVSIERPVSAPYNNVARNLEASEVGSPVGLKKDAKVTISHDEKLQADDILWWSGDGAGIGNLRKIPGLSPFENDQLKKLGKGKDRRLVQAVIARTGPLVGKSIKELKFRTRFNCAVIAVNREGTRVQEHIGKIRLQAGDVLLLEAGPSFVKENAENSRCFALLSEIEDSTPPRMKLLIPSLLLTLAMLVFYTLGVVSLLVAALCAAIAMVACGVLTQSEARDAVNWEIFVTIASAFGIGTAMVNSGVASGMSSFLVRVGTDMGLGSTGLFAMVYLATVLVSNVVTNNAAAALIFPVAMDAAEQGGVSLLNMAFCIMLAASASFMTPFGYQTNLMVYGPGSYKTVDFLRFGTPMQVVLWLWSILLLGLGDSRGDHIVLVAWIFGAATLVAAVLVCFIIDKTKQGDGSSLFSKKSSLAEPELEMSPRLSDEELHGHIHDDQEIEERGPCPPPFH